MTKLGDGTPAPNNDPSCYGWWGVQAVSQKDNFENQKEAINAAGEPTHIPSVLDADSDS